MKCPSRWAGPALALLPALLVGCETPVPRDELDPADFALYEFEHTLMGRTARIQVYSETEEEAKAAVDQAFRAMVRVEQVAGNYSSISEVETVSALSGGSWIPVSEELFAMLAVMLDVAALSDGALDPTIGPFVALWRKVPRTRRLPRPDLLDNAHARVGWRYVDLDRGDRMVQLGKAGMRLDLEAVVQGYAADRALAALVAAGLEMGLVEFGGSIVAGEAPLQTEGWTVRLEGAALGAPAELTLRWSAVSTAGAHETLTAVGPERYSNVIDPRTGRGFTTRNRATATAPSGVLADALAAAARSLGPEQSPAMLAAGQAKGWPIEGWVSGGGDRHQTE